MIYSNNWKEAWLNNLTTKIENNSKKFQSQKFCVIHAGEAKNVKNKVATKIYQCKSAEYY